MGSDTELCSRYHPHQYIYYYPKSLNHPHPDHCSHTDPFPHFHYFPDLFVLPVSILIFGARHVWCSYTPTDPDLHYHTDPVSECHPLTDVCYYNDHETNHNKIFILPLTSIPTCLPSERNTFGSSGVDSCKSSVYPASDETYSSESSSEYIRRFSSRKGEPATDGSYLTAQ